MKAELYHKYNIAPTRIYQYAGDGASFLACFRYCMRCLNLMAFCGPPVVFVPAGCAHQVCNVSGLTFIGMRVEGERRTAHNAPPTERQMADCIKVALDFVSPENIDRCATLTARPSIFPLESCKAVLTLPARLLVLRLSEFQRENLQAKTVWKPDVLALQTTMWHAWMGSRSLDAERKEQGLESASAVAEDVMAKAGKVAEVSSLPPFRSSAY